MMGLQPPVTGAEQEPGDGRRDRDHSWEQEGTAKREDGVAEDAAASATRTGARKPGVAQAESQATEPKMDLNEEKNVSSQHKSIHKHLSTLQATQLDAACGPAPRA